MGTLRRTCATAQQRGPLHKLLWADLLLSLLVLLLAVAAAHVLNNVIVTRHLRVR